MQGTLNKIDIRSILQLIELGQRTSELFVEAYSSSYTSNQEIDPSIGLHSSPSLPTRSWFVFSSMVKLSMPPIAVTTYFACVTTSIATK